MNVSDFFPYLGHSEQHDGLSGLLASLGFDVGKMPGKTQRGYGTAGYELSAFGIELTFEFHTNYTDAYGPPKDGGKAILSGIFAYDRPAAKRRAYTGPIPFTDGPIHNRDDALRKLAVPFHTEQDDEEFEWDHWMKDGLQVGAFYRPDATIKYVSFSVPMKSTLAKLARNS
ncbi:hypothetical protein [Rhizobium sp. LC145]|uniref:hypothetical protein n=1 Tax=Rhizobium sp. LC145 TaxID=1120688 RepID=UPI000629F0E1|nr:hypothetical protein [Rhizobium sp. LC145]KKX25703.1 hypothetical protein YH62_25095 [Rhizobium sp. LC145]TKT57996.1 hypothetical protein FDR95_12545 [Rhizobiaceae bacterium LC148]